MDCMCWLPTNSNDAYELVNICWLYDYYLLQIIHVLKSIIFH